MSSIQKLKPTTSEELLMYNYLRELGKLKYFESFKKLGLDCRFREKVLYDGKVDLYRYIRTIDDIPLCAVAFFLFVPTSDPLEYAYSVYKAIGLSSSFDYYGRMNNIIEGMKMYATESPFFDVVPNYSIPTFEYKESGDFELPWKYVKAVKGGFLLYHPNHTEETEFLPYFVPNEGVTERFNSVDMEEVAKHYRFRINCANGRITDAEPMMIDYSNIVNILTNNISSPEINLNEPVKRCLAGFRKETQIRSEYGRIAQRNSIYLNHLIQKHNFDYSVKECYEIISNRFSSSIIYEDVYIFVIKASDDKIAFVYENVNPDRSTYIFVSEKTRLTEAIDAVTSYFSSIESNKRQTMMNYENIFIDHGVIKDARIYHDNFWRWTYSIDRFIERNI